MTADGTEKQDGLLTVRASGDSGVWRIELVGELDLSNTGLLEAMLQEALDGDGAGQVVLDMREVTFIDSTGIACLVRFTRDEGYSGRLRFLRSKALGVSRVLQLTGIEDRLTPPESAH